MKNLNLSILAIAALLVTSSCNQTKNVTATEASINNTAKTISTPDEALAEMKAGNQRFLDNKSINIDYSNQIEQTKNGQQPHTLILSCLDSRIPPEVIFDQGIGNIFVARVAGNIEDPNILGSMEFATKAVGTKLIIVMGHNKCGAVKGAIDNAELGNLTQLVDQIKPAIVGDKSNMDAMMDATAKQNVKQTISDILKFSPVVNDLVKANSVKIVGAYYDLTTGKVTFL